MNFLQRAFLALVLLVLSGTVRAQTLATAAQGIDAMALPAGPKASALGGAFSAWADDTSAVYWNPAGMAFFPKIQLQTAFNQWFQDTFYQDVSGVWPFSWGALGVHLAYINLGSITQRDAFGYPTGPTLNPEDWGLSFAGAAKFGHLALGLSAKSYLESLPDDSYGTLGLDAGALYRSGALSLSLGARNLGLVSNFTFPTDFFTGGALAWTWGIADLHLATDVDFTTQGTQLHYGVELGYRRTVFLRAGYQWFPDALAGQALTGWSVGAGLALSDVELDYALVSYGDLGSTNQVALSYQFDVPVNKPHQEETDDDDDSPASTSQKQAPPPPVVIQKDNNLSVQTLYKSGMTAYKNKDYAGALTFFHAAAQKPVKDIDRSYSAQANIMLGVLYEYHQATADHIARAIHYYQASLKIEPDNGTVQKHLGELGIAGSPAN